MQRPLKHTGAAIVLGLLIPAYALTAEMPDLTKIDRRIAKEPKYTAKRPLVRPLRLWPSGHDSGLGRAGQVGGGKGRMTMSCTSTATPTAT